MVEVTGQKEGPGGAHQAGHGHAHSRQGSHVEHGHHLLPYLLLLCGLQVLLFVWHRKAQGSFLRVSLFFLLILPPALTVLTGGRHLRFLCEWLLYVSLAARMVFLATRQTIASETPRKVYRFFHTMHRVTLGAILLGYGLQVVTALIPPLSHVHALLAAEGSLIMEGLFFGVLNRDCAGVCADMLSASLGFGSAASASTKGNTSSSTKENSGARTRWLSPSTWPVLGKVIAAAVSSEDPGASGSGDGPVMPRRNLAPNVCAVCAGLLRKEPGEVPDPAAAAADEEATVVLDCQHRFHEFCIRGWVIIGKKNLCPCCGEKVNTSAFNKGWDQSAMYATILDVARYFMVWNPFLFAVLHYGLALSDYF